VHNIYWIPEVTGEICIPRLLAGIQLVVRAGSGFNIPAGWAFHDAVSLLEPLEAFNNPVPMRD
jgi:hypothetical protein